MNVPNDEHASAAAPRVERFEFTGTGAEYFRIWIVNLLLTLVTLGIYSAWAKVRRLRYFYGNTQVAGSAFAYHATPMQILRGRILAVLLFMLYALVSETMPLIGLAMALLFLIALPWIVLRALTFRARVSSYRNIRFDFVQDLGGAVRTYVGLAILVPLTLFTLYPYFDLARYRYSIGKSKYGQTQFSVQTRPGAFYRVYAISFALLLGGIVLALVPLFLLGLSFESPAYLALAAPIYLGVTLFAGAYLTAGLQNAIYGETTLGPHRLSSTLQPGPLFRIYLVNTLLIVITLGLYTPFAQVRLARYRFEQLSLQVEGSLDRFVASQAQGAPGAAGEEVAEVFDVELGV